MAATLQSRLPAIIAELRPKVSKAVKVGAELIAEEARTRVPVGPPDKHLKDHIHVEREGPAAYYVVAGDDDVFYGHMVEHGTAHSGPHPFLVPSVEASRDEVVAAVTVALRGL